MSESALSPQSGRPSRRPAGRSGGKKDLTFLAVRRQLTGMNVNSYEVGIRNQATGAMQIKTYEPKELEKAVGFLKARNYADCDIYIRPQPATSTTEPLILMDDVSRTTIDRMQKEGIEPACEIETSPDNFQLWIRVGENPISHTQATAIAKHLAKTYEGDPNSADYRHFGRLAGFTNRKPIHRDVRGRAPFVLAHDCKGNACSRGDELLTIQPLDVSAKRRLTAIPSTRQPKQDGALFYREQLAFYQAQYGSSLDVSRADWAIVGKMIDHGYQAGEIIAILDAESPQIDERKRGHVQDYIERTVAKRIALSR